MTANSPQNVGQSAGMNVPTSIHERRRALLARIRRALEAGERGEALAVRLGVSLRTIQSWASGTTRPPTTRLAALERAMEEDAR